MRNTMIGAILMVASMSVAASFTDVDTTKHQGKTGLKSLITALDANFALIEAGTETVTMAPAYLYVGSATSQKVAVAVSGDVTMGNDGAVAIASDVIINADVKSDAAIATSKLAADAVRSGDSTPNQLIQAGTSDVADTTTQTNTFTVAYKSATIPVVVASYACPAADVAPLFVTSIASNQFVVTLAATNMPITWMAIGQKP
jgi:hypothetical protein